MDQQHCEQLLEEYRALRRRLEERDFASGESGQQPSVRSEDVDRLQELKRRLDTECDIDMPTDSESDLDLPDHAGSSPSEPMN